MIKSQQQRLDMRLSYELISNGISINATLVFSPDQAQKSFKAITKGISKCEADGGCRA